MAPPEPIGPTTVTPDYNNADEAEVNEIEIIL